MLLLPLLILCILSIIENLLATSMLFRL